MEPNMEFLETANIKFSETVINVSHILYNNYVPAYDVRSLTGRSEIINRLLRDYCSIFSVRSSGNPWKFDLKTRTKIKSYINRLIEICDYLDP
jgi:hypothetical protein